MACVSGGGLGSCVFPNFDEHCSTRHKSTHPCSQRPSEVLQGKRNVSSHVFIFTTITHVTYMLIVYKTPITCDVRNRLSQTASYRIRPQQPTIHRSSTRFVTKSRCDILFCAIVQKGLESISEPQLCTSKHVSSLQCR